MRGSLRVGLFVVIAALAGYALGRYRGHEPPQDLPLQQILQASAGSPAASSRAQSDSGSHSEPLERGPATLADTLRLKGDFTQTAALYILASTVDRKGLERLLTEAAALKQPSERNAATSILYARYAEIDPEAAVDHIMRRADFQPGWLQSVFHTWSRADLDAALARASTLDPMGKNAAAFAIVRARDDLPSAEREKIAATFNMRVAPANPSPPIDVRTPERALRAWQDALAVSDYNSRLGRLMSVTNMWVQQDPHAALEAIASLEDVRTRDQLTQTALANWAQRAPRDALDWALARPPSQGRVRLVGAALGTLASKEPLAAVNVLTGLTSAEQRQLTPQVVAQWAATDPRSAAAWVEQLEDPLLRKTALSSVVSAYASRRPDEAYRWASSLQSPEGPQIVSQVIQTISWNDPVRASGLLQQLPESPSRDQVAQQVASAWAQRDPQAALAWVSRFSASSAVRGTMHETLFRQWAGIDAETAAAKVVEIDDTEVRNRAISGVLSSTYLDASTADRLYERIEGAEARRRAAATMYYSWRERDPRVAERYRNLAGIRQNQPGMRTVITQ